MQRISMFLSLALLLSGCDEVDHAGNDGTVSKQREGGAQELAADLWVCAGEDEDDAVACVFASVDVDLEADESTQNGGPLQLRAPEPEPVGSVRKPKPDCWSYDGKVSCYCDALLCCPQQDSCSCGYCQPL
jgi:hypothetical protein